jgi:murein DD-endopeptidase MepM/ murein hydrolase activator NlpD
MITPNPFAPDAPQTGYSARQKRMCERLASITHVPLRYLMTRDGGLRLRYIVSMAAGIACLGTAVAWNLPSGKVVTRVSQEVVAGVTHNLLTPSTYRLRYAKASQLPDAVQMASADTFNGPVQKVLEVGKGETVSEVLQDAGIAPTTAAEVVAAMSDHQSPQSIKAGQNLRLQLVPRNGKYDFDQLSMEIDPVSTLHIRRGIDGKYASQLDKLPLTKTVQAARVRIRNSVYGSAAAAGIPGRVVASAIKTLGHSVDLQRDIKTGDTLELLYEVSVAPDGRVMESGNLLLARINLSGKDIALYRYESKGGEVSFFRPDGYSVSKSSLLRTPVDGARMTSGFGMRRHPILGYSKLHKGVDFGASTGTPVYAAGDGTIEKASWFSSYGNYVKIKHNSTLKTAYAHLKGYAKGIKPGAKVKQGQIIGYVGMTGRSTGPHLHYEVLVNNKQVNPGSYKAPKSPGLEAAEAKRFKDFVKRTDETYSDAISAVREASTSGQDVVPGRSLDGKQSL